MSYRYTHTFVKKRRGRCLMRFSTFKFRVSFLREKKLTWKLFSSFFSVCLCRESSRKIYDIFTHTTCFSFFFYSFCWISSNRFSITLCVENYKLHRYLLLYSRITCLLVWFNEVLLSHLLFTDIFVTTKRSYRQNILTFIK